MAWETGTATNYLDLVGKLRDFLTANTTLVSLGQNWTRLQGPTGAVSASDEFIFQGPGLAGTDEILVGVKTYTDASLSRFNLGIAGMFTYNASFNLTNQPNRSPFDWLLLANSPITYWFIANGRCFKIIARIGSSYEQGYGGFLLPEHLPEDWPYPLFIGGSHWSNLANQADTNDYHQAFWHGGALTIGQDSSNFTNAYLLDVGLVWRRVSNWYSTTRTTNSLNQYQVTIGPWYTRVDTLRFRKTLNNNPYLRQATIQTEALVLGKIFYGRLDGVYHCPSFGVVAEQIITIGGTDYIVMPNVFRSTDGDMAAFALQ